MEGAITTLRAARERFPDDYDIGYGLATILRDAGDQESFERIMRELNAN